MTHPTLFPIILLFLTASLVRAQTPPAPKATPPCVSQAPAHSSWTILIKPKVDHSAKAGDAPDIGSVSAGAKPTLLNQIQIDKAESMRRILRKWSDGKVAETWWIGPLCLAEFPTQGGSGPLQVGMIDTAAPIAGPDLGSGTLDVLASGGDYKNDDFPELAWINPSLLVGTETKNENLYRVYRITAPSPSQPSNQTSQTPLASPSATKRDVTVLKEAWIDAKSGLPLSLFDGQSVWSYTFSPGSDSLPLPPRFEDAFRSYREAHESAKHRKL